MKCHMGGELILKHNSTTDTPDLCPTVRGTVVRNVYHSSRDPSTEDMLNRFVYHFSLGLKWCNAYGRMHSSGQTCEEGVEGGASGGGKLGVVKLSADGTKIIIDTRVLENEWVTDRIDLNQ